ncbi:hypothetical protein MTO96_005704 [Rhipicephalus appendiculatus]
MQGTDQVGEKRLRLRRSLRESGWRDGFRGEPRDDPPLQYAEKEEALIRAACLQDVGPDIYETMSSSAPPSSPFAMPERHRETMSLSAVRDEGGVIVSCARGSLAGSNRSLPCRLGPLMTVREGRRAPRTGWQLPLAFPLKEGSTRASSRSSLLPARSAAWPVEFQPS